MPQFTHTSQLPQPFDPARFVLGSLCRRGHDYYGTGQSLRTLGKRECYACKLATSTAYYHNNTAEVHRRRREVHVVDHQRRRERDAAYFQAHADRYRDQAAAYREANRETIRAQQAGYRAAHKQQIQRRNLNYYQRHRAEFSAAAAQYRATHQDAIRENMRRYRQANPDRMRVIWHRRRLRERAGGPCFTVEQWQALKARYGHLCLRCGRGEPHIKLTPDHILPLSRGGTNAIENIQPLCYSCNCSKSTKHIDYRGAWR